MSLPVGEGRNARPTPKKKQIIPTGNVPIPGTGVSIKPQALSPKPKVQKQIRQAVQVAKYKAAPVAVRKQILAQPAAPKAIRKVHAARKQQAEIDTSRKAILGTLLRGGEEITAPRLGPGLHASQSTVAELVKKGKATPLPAAQRSILTPLLHTSVGTVVVKPALKAAAHAIPKGIVKNAVNDAAELAVTTPTSLAYAATHPAKVAKMAGEQYKELATHPGKFIHDSPVTAALMVLPGATVPGRMAGKALRLAGKQTLEREPAILPGTALRQQRTRSRGAIRNTLQARADKNRTAPVVMKPKEVNRRVDEFYATGKLHTNRVLSSAAEQAQAKAKTLPPDKQAEHIAQKMEGAKKGAKQQVRRKFVEEFGATEHGPFRPGSTPEGVLHTTREAAQAAADQLSGMSVLKVGKNKFGVVPEEAFARLRHHERIGKSKATGAKILKVGGQQFRASVLPFSTRWLLGQGVEPAFRSAVAGAGPTSFIRARRTIKEMNRQIPGSGDQLRAHAVPGGVFGLSSTAREFAYGEKTLGDQFQKTALHKGAQTLTNIGAKPGVRHVRAGFRKYSEFVFGKVNNAFEQTAQTAMLGKAIKSGPLMERHVLGLSDKAIEDAAKGLHATEAQVALGREVDRMFGRYNKFGPETREALLHWTPFLPWSINVLTFLGRTLPADHPIIASLTASIDQATEDWKQKHGMSLRGGSTRPGFMLGGYPIGKGDTVLPVGRVLPFAPGGNVLSTAGSLLVPQYSALGKNLFLGTDWKDQPLKSGTGVGSRVANALATAAETFVPGTSQVGRVTGLTGHYIRKTGEPSVLQGKNVTKDLVREVNPLRTTKSKSQATGKPGTIGKIVLPKGDVKIGKIVLPENF